MKLKSKYNVGDVVRFYNYTTSKYEIGAITRIHVEFSLEKLQKTWYTIETVKIKKAYTSFATNVDEYDILQKLNKKAFNKAYAEECAKSIVQGDNEK